MFLALFFILFLCWIVGWLMFHVASGLIHLLLVLALISFVWHLVRGGTALGQP